MTTEDFEAEYLDRAARIAADPDVAMVAPELFPRPAKAGRVLVGWWTRPGAAEHFARLPNPWDDPRALALSEQRAGEVARSLLRRLAPILNEAHGIDRSERAWELVLLPWLDVTVSIVLDRRLFCLAAAAGGAPMLAAPGPLEPPASVWDAIGIQLTETWNLALMEVLGREAGIDVIPRPHAPDHPEPGHDRLRSGWWLLQRALRAIPFLFGLARARLRRDPAPGPAGTRNVLLLGQIAFAREQAHALVRATSGLVLAPPVEVWAPSPHAEDHVARRSLAELRGADPLEDAVGRLLPRLLPRTILERHQEVAQRSRYLYGEPTHVVHGNWAWGDPDNEFLAACRDAGKRIAFAQHGGTSYQLAVKPPDRLERQAGDLQLAWGHTSGPERTAPSPYISRLLDTHEGGDSIVVVENLTPPLTWPFRLTSTPIGDQCFDDEALLVDFVQALGCARPKLLLKRYPGYAYEGRRHPVLEALPATAGLRPRRATDWLREARLAVIAYPDTPFLEAMAIGVPVIGIWDPRWWRMRPDAEEPFEELVRLGVIHRDGASGAAKVEQVFRDPGVWWLSDAVQDARRRFLHRFAAGGDWLAGWSAAIGDLTGGDRSGQD